ncbi:MAG: DUF1778 domain-containing protein [Sinobacteraceae bacterium]|nr:DUF1778 domain-containing protein [Nevskiaceae bacterium]
MTATARLDLRMDAQDKDKITHAAELRGIPVATFVRLAALRAAEAVATEANTLALSPAETKRLLAALDKPFKPSARLQHALDQERNVVLDRNTAMPALAARLRGRATARLSTDEIMQLTRGA